MSSKLEILKSHFGKGLVLDTGPLVLYIFGSCYPSQVEEWSNTSGFTSADFLLLREIIKKFRILITTPNIATETNSFLSQLDETRRKVCRNFFKEHIEVCEEVFVSSIDASRSKYFKFLGLTDAAILGSVTNKMLVLSTDGLFVHELAKFGIPTCNFNHLRQANWAA